jgi:hypothetical protein
MSRTLSMEGDQVSLSKRDIKRGIRKYNSAIISVSRKHVTIKDVNNSWKCKFEILLPLLLDKMNAFTLLNNSFGGSYAKNY